MAGVAIKLAKFDFEAVFRAEYGTVSRIISRVVHDDSRAQDLAAEVFWRLSRKPKAQGRHAIGWLYRTATRLALDELRKQVRREKYEQLAVIGHRPETPEELYLKDEETRRVRVVLARLRRRDSEVLLLRNNDLSYDEIASALDLNPASIGTLLRRAEEAFRKEYVRRYKA